MASLLLGRSVIDITPPVGLHLTGWLEERYSTFVHQPLTCRVLYLVQADRVDVIVSLDLLGISGGFAGEIRADIERELGIPGAFVMLACTHTHSSPILPPWTPDQLPEPDSPYIADLKRKVVGAVRTAMRSPEPVSVGFGRGAGDLGVNRRLPYLDGKVGYPPKANPEGPVDQEIGVLRFDSESGGTLAVLFSYGCHPTVGGSSKWIGSDFPGQARKLVESFYGEGTTAVFLLGNCGDVRSGYLNPDGTFRWDVSTYLVEEAGNRVGAEVIKASVGIRCEQPAALRFGNAFADIYMTNGEVAERCEFQALRIGDAVIVTNPGECFSQIGLDLRRETDLPVIFSSITNGYVGYVPTKDAYPFGGYEVETAYVSFGLSAPIRDDGESIFYNGMLTALRRALE